MCCRLSKYIPSSSRKFAPHLPLVTTCVFCFNFKHYLFTFQKYYITNRSFALTVNMVGDIRCGPSKYQEIFTYAKGLACFMWKTASKENDLPKLSRFCLKRGFVSDHLFFCLAVYFYSTLRVPSNTKTLNPGIFQLTFVIYTNLSI